MRNETSAMDAAPDDDGHVGGLCAPSQRRLPTRMGACVRSQFHNSLDKLETAWKGKETMKLRLATLLLFTLLLTSTFASGTVTNCQQGNADWAQSVATQL